MINDLLSISATGQPRTPATTELLDLQQRVDEQMTERRPDHAFDELYQALLDRDEVWQNEVLGFLKAYLDRDGNQPYRTNGKQMEVLQLALKRMKEQGLDKTDLYEQTYKAFTTVFGVKAFINQFSQEVFDPEAISKLEEESGW